MTRIGFSYNQKPAAPIGGEGQGVPTESAPGFDAEPPSFSRSNGTRGASATAVTPQVASQVDDIYAEWDAPETIAAVERALSGLGEVIRLEATPDFPQRLRETRPDIVFNMAEGLSGQNREAHVPAICEFFGVPYSGSDPFTLSLALHKARTKQLLRSSEGAEMEIRRFAVATLRLLQREAPGFFSDFVMYVADDRREAARVEFHKV